MAAKIACNLRLSDVHAMADTVGREFKNLADQFGGSCIAQLVPPVVEALERLEAYVESYQKMQTRLCELMMENDTVAHERERRAKLAVENEEQVQTIRQLQREKRSFLLQLDELQSKEVQESEGSSGVLSLSSSSSSSLPPNCHPADVHPTHSVADKDYQKNSSTAALPPSMSSSAMHGKTTLPHSHASNSSSSTPSTPHLLHSHTSHPSHSHTSHNSHSHAPHAHSPFSRFINRCSRAPYSATSVPIHKPYNRSSSLTDMATHRVNIPTASAQNDNVEDVYERSRVTRRLSMVENELDTTRRRLKESQKCLRKIEQENKQLKIRLEEFRAEAGLREIEASRSHKSLSGAVPRYYKEEMIRVLTDRNSLKEKLVSLQEELDGVRQMLRKFNYSKRLPDVVQQRDRATVRSMSV